MFDVRGKKIQENPVKVVDDVSNYLFEVTGKRYLRDISYANNNIQCTCPIHKNGDEKSPSCGITVNDKGNTKGGTFHCFTCGYTASIDKVISDVLKLNDGGEHGFKWLKSKYKLSNKKPIMKIERKKREKEEISYVEEELLEKYRVIHPYMRFRGLSDNEIEKYDIGYSESKKSLTFPVRDVRGRTLFVAQRSVDSKNFFLPPNVKKTLYGIYELDYKRHDLYICESFLDAHTLSKWNYNPIALMGTGSYEQYELINKLPHKIIYLCLDGDKAGDEGNKRLCKYINMNKLIYIVVMPRGKDINDLTEVEFNKLKRVRC